MSAAARLSRLWGSLAWPGRIGLVIVAFWLAMALFGAWIAPYDVGAVIAQDVFGAFSARHPLGTDYLGRDMLSRILHGSRFTIGLALAIIAEATLSFLGVGVPPTQPSLGTLIRVGQGFLFSGEWWIILFPSIALLALALSVNLLGDWLRDALNPRLK